MSSYAPKHVPRYVRAGDAALGRARLKRRLIWTAAAIPLILALLAFGYSDQAPAFLRSSIITVDRALGYPIIGLLSLILG
jgi:hypothetical protein